MLQSICDDFRLLHHDRRMVQEHLDCTCNRPGIDLVDG